MQRGFGGSGGDGKAMLIVSLISTVVGVAATYYVVTEMQKQSEQSST